MDTIQFELNAAMKIPSCGYGKGCLSPAAWFAMLIGKGEGMIAPTLCWTCQVHKPDLDTFLAKLTAKGKP